MPFRSPEYRKAYQSANREKLLTTNRLFYKRHAMAERERARRRYAFHKECLRMRAILFDGLFGETK